MTEILHYSDNDILEMILKSGLRPSVQRIAVLSFIANRRTHPSADEIFTSLSTEFPSLSRTTVYNSLHALVEASLVRELEIESGLMRYDLAPQSSHGHFICRRCGKIYDTALPDRLDGAVMPGFTFDSIELVYRGICPACSDSRSETL